MKEFLDNINPTEELRERLSGGQMKAMRNKSTEKVQVTFSDVSILPSHLNLELYLKTKESIKKMLLDLETINIDGINYSNDIIKIYENFREYVKYYLPSVNLSHLTLVPEGNIVKIKVTNDNVVSTIKGELSEIMSYLSQFKITNLQFDVELDKEHINHSKLETLITNSDEVVLNVKKETVIDEKIKEGFDPVEFHHKDVNQVKVYYQGILSSFEEIEAKSGIKFWKFTIEGIERAVEGVLFKNKWEKGNAEFPLVVGKAVRVYGKFEYNDYSNAHQMAISGFDNVQRISNETIEKLERDTTGLVRHEFHVHTKMSPMDAVANIKDYVKYAEAYNIGSLTIMDHNTAQSFPDGQYLSKTTDVKINYGVELDVYDDLNTEIVLNEREQNLHGAEYVYFDLETTSISALLSEIIEFGAVKYKDNKVIDRKQVFIKPSQPISQFTTDLTSITNDDLAHAPSLPEVIEEIKDWIGDAILVAHNASFDYNFLNKAYLDNGLGEITNPVIDSMKVSWLIHPKSRGHRLGLLARHEFVDYDDLAAHRADYDAEVLCKIFERLIHKLSVEHNIRTLKELNDKTLELKDFFFAKHITIVSKNQRGLRDINEIVSLANIDYFNVRKKTPSMPLSFFLNKENKLLDNIMVGSACSNSFLWEAIMDDDKPRIHAIMGMYDYLEIFPPTAYKHMLAKNFVDHAGLKTIFKKIVELGKEYDIPVIVSSNAHYTIKEEKEVRNILISAKRVGGGAHPLHDFKNPNGDKPDNHLRTTQEIFEEFNGIFDKDTLMDLVIDNPAILQSRIEPQRPIHDKLYPPKLPEAEEKLKQSIYDRLKELYGDEPNPRITERLERELKPILDHGFGIIYYLSAVAVKKSMDDGYLVGSRGSVGSSLAATLSGITEVNPMEPHYRCPNCKFHEFVEGYDSGYDLPDRNCPVCQTKMIGDGNWIPFETFLGFNADKVPDIDLNFSRDNQDEIHEYMKEFLGADNVYRAGTIGTAANKTAKGYVLNYAESTGQNIQGASLELLAKKVEGSKRTTGQHPGGLIVIPSDMSIYDFTPINYAGDNVDSELTTHFDFHSIHDNLLKLDFLGHLDPSSIRMLQNLTGVDPQTIPMNDKAVISLFKDSSVLKYEEDYTGDKLGIYGLPEFGTSFVRGMVSEAKPQSFSDLVRISGLSHGTDVWLKNAQRFIKEGTATLSEVITVRDDIMTYLIGMGVEKSLSFKIMESVRKGQGVTDEQVKAMKDANVPDWYIESCKLIKYMFPKAHAVAYVTMAFRIAWYKINYPLEYYATYFSKRDVEIDLGVVTKGIKAMKNHYAELEALPWNEKQKKEKDLMETYNIIFEMYSRGIKFTNVDIHRSRSSLYSVDRETNSIIPPFVILEGVGEAVAENVTKARKERDFQSVADFKNRCGIPGTILKKFDELGIFKDVQSNISNNEQLSLFE